MGLAQQLRRRLISRKLLADDPQAKATAPQAPEQPVVAPACPVVAPARSPAALATKAIPEDSREPNTNPVSLATSGSDLPVGVEVIPKSCAAEKHHASDLLSLLVARICGGCCTGA